LVIRSLTGASFVTFAAKRCHAHCHCSCLQAALHVIRRVRVKPMVSAEGTYAAVITEASSHDIQVSANPEAAFAARYKLKHKPGKYGKKRVYKENQYMLKEVFMAFYQATQNREPVVCFSLILTSYTQIHVLLLNFEFYARLRQCLQTSSCKAMQRYVGSRTNQKGLVCFRELH